MSQVARAGQDRQHRGGIDRPLRLLPYLALAGSTALCWLAGLNSWPMPIILALVAGTAGWMLWFVTLHPAWAQRRGLMAVFFAGLIGWILLLIAGSGLFGFFAWSGYLFVLQALHGRWMLVGASAVGVCSSIAQMGGFPALGHREALPAFAVVLAFNIGIGGTMTVLAAKADRAAERRQQMLEELGEANAKLAAAMQENAGLHAQLLAQAREAGVLDERQRLAGEIHDILAQGLTGIVTQLEAAEQADERPADRRRHLHQARRLARDSLTEARRSVQALSPQPLAAAALPEALTEVVDGWSGRTGVRAALITTGTAQPLLPEIETTLLRTAQEALANVARHARASRVALTLSYMEDVVSLDVRDDGAGFDPAAPRTAGAGGGFGLAAMRERLHRIAGQLEVESEPGGGTAISATAPAIRIPAVTA